jgi:hypothetical protein
MVRSAVERETVELDINVHASTRRLDTFPHESLSTALKAFETLWPHDIGIGVSISQISLLLTVLESVSSTI